MQPSPELTGTDAMRPPVGTENSERIAKVGVTVFEITEAGRDALGLREALIVALEAADQLFEHAEAWEAARRANGLEPFHLDVIRARLRMARLAVEQHVGPSWPLKPSQLFQEE